jgi:hypothetical protein
VLYNLADAWIPPAPGRPGGGDVDLAPGVARRLRGAGERRALEWALLWIEWEPRLRFESLRGFAWLPRQRRQELLAHWEHSRFALRRRLAARLRELVEESWAECVQSRVGA